MLLTFVCSGNTCRSPLAVAAWGVVAREMKADCGRKLARITVESAGLNARRGAAATPMAQLIAAGWNADLSEHQARVWRPEFRRRETQIVLAMTREQAAQIRFQLEMQPKITDVTVEVLGAYGVELPHSDAQFWGDDAGEMALDIPDPYGGSSEAYEECAARILRAMRGLARALCRD